MRGQLVASRVPVARYAELFSQFPLQHAFLDIRGMFPAQLRRATGRIRLPDEAREGEYDFVCIGSPTWWLTTCMPIRAFMKPEAAGLLLNRFAVFVVCRRYRRTNLTTVRKLGAKQGRE